MILLISTCTEKIHELEFVNPIKEILKQSPIELFEKHYKFLKKEDLQKASKIIICGTSLDDDNYLKDIKSFEWIKNINKPILGICSGMQIISIIFGSKIKTKKEIGKITLNFKKDFLGLKGKKKVYELHKNYVELSKNFEQFNKEKIPQAIKHSSKTIYATLFHPEVLNKEVIVIFCKLD